MRSRNGRLTWNRSASSRLGHPALSSRAIPLRLTVGVFIFALLKKSADVGEFLVDARRGGCHLGLVVIIVRTIRHLGALCRDAFEVRVLFRRFLLHLGL